MSKINKLIGFSRGGDSKSNCNDCSLKTTSEIAHEIGRYAKSNSGTILPLKTTADLDF